MHRKVDVLSTNTGNKEPCDKTPHSKGFSEDSLYSGSVGASCKVAPEIGHLLVPGTVDCAYFRCDNEDSSHPPFPRSYL